MSDRPMIFGAPMVRALLDGRKTMTRRLLKPQPVEIAGLYWDNRAKMGWRVPGELAELPRPKNLMAPGDRIWVKEAHFGGTLGVANVVYRVGGYRGIKWRSPIYMPRRLSRLTLIVAEVNVERLQDIGWRDVRDEGAYTPNMWESFDEIFAPTVFEAREKFAKLWDSIHGSGAWYKNPWIMAIRFTVHNRNIDAMESTDENHHREHRQAR